MLNYELIKELEEAGFPQHSRGDYGEHNCGCANIYYCTPTLSELIKACGEDFYSLKKQKTAWFAVSAGHKYRVEGSSPEFAVAKLWLALQKNHA